jgi:hypothetical protein
MGTSEFSFLPDLPVALNSLNRMAEMLTGPLCGWPVNRVALLVNARGPGDVPDRLITAFEDAVDVALFYYVGHGQIDLANQLCLGLVGSRTEANRRAATSLPFEAVRRAMLDSPAAMKIVILDCCFAGLASLPGNSLAASPDDVLDRTAGSGAYTMAASAAYSPAWYDTTPGAVRPQTFFTQYLVDLIEDGIPGQPAGLRLHPMFVRLSDRLASDKRPAPVERSVDAARDFVFAHNAAPPEVQRDLGREIAELTRRLADSEARRAAAEAARDQARVRGEARERALRAEIAERASELQRLRGQVHDRATMPARERQELDEAIGEAQRLLDETTAAHEVATRTRTLRPASVHVAQAGALGNARDRSRDSERRPSPRITPAREDVAPRGQQGLLLPTSRPLSRMPLPISLMAVFAGITMPYIVLLIVIGLPFNHTLVWLYVLPPGALTWLATRPVIEGKRLPELVESQVRYLIEPRAWGFTCQRGDRPGQLTPGKRPAGMMGHGNAAAADRVRVHARRGGCHAGGLPGAASAGAACLRRGRAVVLRAGGAVPRLRRPVRQPVRARGIAGGPVEVRLPGGGRRPRRG